MGGPLTSIRLTLDELARVRCVAEGLLPAEVTLSATGIVGDHLDLVDPEGVRVARLIQVSAAGPGLVQGTIEVLDAPTEPTYPELRPRPTEVVQKVSGPTLAMVGEYPPTAAELAAAIQTSPEGAPAAILGLAVAGGVRDDDARHHEAIAEWITMRDNWPGPMPFHLALTPLWAAAPEADRQTAARRYGATNVVLLSDEARNRTAGATVLFTGLSGSGKSTVAARLVRLLTERHRRTVTLLDGDVVRTHLSSELGFSRADRETNVRRIGWVAAEVTKHGGLAVAAPIAPYAATRAEVRTFVERAGGLGSFFLVHVSTPLEECERRDRKGLYAKARRGEILEFTGISDPYELPSDADLTIDTTYVSADDAAAQVLAALVQAGRVRLVGTDDHAGANGAL
jgi:sulfate adenylyltransferase